MWVLKLNVLAEKQVLGSFAVAHEVSIAGYTLSTYEDEKNLYLIGSGFIFGEEKNKKRFLRDLKKQDWVVNLDFKGDFGIIVMKEPLYSRNFWNPKVIQLSPIIVNHREKKHVWHFGSFDRKALGNVLKFAEKYLGAELVYFKEKAVTNVSFTRLLPELTGNQKRALEIAISHGYYDYPKKVKMERLAKEMGISYSTYQAHLKKAEGKILPEVYREL
jgi:predicted DNA binding protein